MQIVIDIPDDIYQKIEERRADVYYDYRLPLWVLHMIDKGTPLPEHHGRLIDESKIKGIFTWDNGYVDCDAPTVIEATEEDE